MFRDSHRTHTLSLGEWLCKFFVNQLLGVLHVFCIHNLGIKTGHKCILGLTCLTFQVSLQPYSTRGSHSLKQDFSVFKPFQPVFMVEKSLYLYSAIKSCPLPARNVLLAVH